MVNLARRIMQGVAVLALAVGFYRASADDLYLNDNHRQWNNGINKAKALRQSNPKEMSALEAKMFYESYRKSRAMEGKPSEKEIKLPPYNKSKLSDMQDLFMTAGFYAYRVSGLAGAINVGNASGYDLSWSVKKVVPIVMKNRTYTDFFKKLTESDDIDCKAYSTTAAATVFAIKKNSDNVAPIKIIAGLFFDKNSLPNGTGHQWVELEDGNRIDASLKTPAGNKAYVPITGVELSRIGKNSKLTLTPRIFCLTPDINK